MNSPAPMLCLILSLVLLGPVSVCQGQSLFDPDTLMDVQVDTGEPVQTKKPEQESLLGTFLDRSVWTLGYRASHRTGSDPKLINNHLFLRQQMDTLVFETYFFKLDWKASSYPKTDHRAEAEDKDVYLEADLREGYILAGYDNFGIKLGKQINVWGK
ncbi:MAG: hypothetical protein GY860_19350, partial [Desulfobacteraceae bacterium]|nr:hypothetical protein [Desulfobacteraceae bacterium]